MIAACEPLHREAARTLGSELDMARESLSQATQESTMKVAEAKRELDCEAEKCRLTVADLTSQIVEQQVNPMPLKMLHISFAPSITEPEQPYTSVRYFI